MGRIRLALTPIAVTALGAPAWTLAAQGASHVEARGQAIPAALAQEVSVRAGEHGLAPADALAPVAQAAARGVPPDLVAAKVLEGLSKGVPPSRVVSVANELGERLARAGDLLSRAERAGLAPPRDRRSALQDLGAALGAGVEPRTVASLVDVARGGTERSADAAVAGAFTMGELARRGVPLADTTALGAAVARRGSARPAEIPALFDAWRAEGGRDARAFLAEATRRVEGGRTLDGVVDPFARSPDHILADSAGRRTDRQDPPGVSAGKHGVDEGLSPAERTDSGRGAVPGLDAPGQTQGKSADHRPPKK